MASKKFRNEFVVVVNDLEDFSIHGPMDDIDDVWTKLIGDINEYNKSLHYPDYYEFVPGPNFSIEESERPDIIYECDDFIMGIECFEFDASKKTKRGSKQKQKEAEAERAILEKYHQITERKDGIISIEKTIDVEFSITSYCESLATNYLKHVKSITEYRKRLTEKSNGKRVLLSFFVEDTTALGNRVVANGKVEPLDPLKLPFFLGMLAATQGLDYILIKTKDMYVPSLRIQQITIPLLKELSNDCYGSDCRFLQYTYKRQSDFCSLDNNED